MTMEITFEELVIELMPFSDELIDWCKQHPDFLKALKNVYSDRFISLGAIVVSQPRSRPMDEVIGVYTYDYKAKNPKFKQDFIVNVEKINKKFILYTRNNKIPSSKYVKDIKEFYKLYGVGGDYANSHHLTLAELPDEIKPRAADAIELAKKYSNAKLVYPDQNLLNKVYKEVKDIKSKEWKIKKRIKK